MGSEQTEDGLVPESDELEVAAPSALAALDLSTVDIPRSLEKATKVPFSELGSLGAGFASIPSAFRTINQTIDIPTKGLYRLTDEAGNAISPDKLMHFKGNSKDLLGSFRDKTGLHQAHHQAVASQQVKMTTTLPCDPATLFMAATLMEISKKLDSIQETQQEMFEYIRNKDKAEIRGDLETLSDILTNYRFNWDNAQYKNNKHILVQQIRNDAEKAIIQHQTQLESRLGKKKLIHAEKHVRDKAEDVREELEEYRLSIYLYSFSSFLEILLLENYDPEYLAATSGKIEERSLRYRELYTQAYNALEADAESSLQAFALGGVSKIAGHLGGVLGKTPVGTRTKIDEALQGASDGISGFNEKMKLKTMSRIVDAHASDVRPFIDSIENVNRIHNEPVMVLADDEAIYMLPAGEGC